MDKIKVLNLYAGIGGNRKLWENVEVTAVEINPEIAKIYQDFFPEDKVVVGDAHKYLLEHYREFDFIWSSPPCPTHSRMNNLKFQQIDKGFKPKFPDMKLYEEIVFLKHWFKGKWVVENVISYYDPLIKPQKSNNHYFWCNFIILNQQKDIRGIRSEDIKYKEKRNGFDFSDKDVPKRFKKKVLNNCVKPEVGLSVFNCAYKSKQQKLLSVSHETQTQGGQE
jgi:DNA (cytosine-5)-methyltransferase 1